MNFSELSVYLIKGAFYKCKNKIYLVGANVPAIANVFVQQVTKDGDLIGDIDALYHRQHKNWKILKNDIIIKDKYKENIQVLFCYGYSDFDKKKRNNDLPIVYQYLECGRINSIKKYAKSKGEKNINEFMLWAKNNCKYYAPYNQLIYYNPFINDKTGCAKSDEELYNIYKNQTSEY